MWRRRGRLPTPGYSARFRAGPEPGAAAIAVDFILDKLVEGRMWEAYTRHVERSAAAQARDSPARAQSTLVVSMDNRLPELYVMPGVPSFAVRNVGAGAKDFKWGLMLDKFLRLLDEVLLV